MTDMVLFGVILVVFLMGYGGVNQLGVFFVYHLKHREDYKKKNQVSDGADSVYNRDTERRYRHGTDAGRTYSGLSILRAVQRQDYPDSCGDGGCISGEFYSAVC